MVLLEFSVSPLGVGESVSAVVARCLEIVERSGLDYQLHAMGTLVEGELDPVLNVLKQCMEAVAADHARVTCTAKFDWRKGHTGRLQAKVASVERQLGRALNKTPGKPT
ncbi:MAG TPA: MTH1187 family thiamine-binding protein [Pirellulales bacterium]